MDSGVATGFSRASRVHRFHWPRGNAKWAKGRGEKTKRGARYTCTVGWLSWNACHININYHVDGARVVSCATFFGWKRSARRRASRETVREDESEIDTENADRLDERTYHLLSFDRDLFSFNIRYATRGNKVASFAINYYRAQPESRSGREILPRTQFFEMSGGRVEKDPGEWQRSMDIRVCRSTPIYRESRKDPLRTFVWPMNPVELMWQKVQLVIESRPYNARQFYLRHER